MYLADAIEWVVLLGATPPKVNARSFNLKTHPIYVPADAVGSYKSSSSWINNNFADRVQANPGLP